MNYNQILGKINEETRKKVADEYNEIHKKYIVPEDYSGSVNLIDRLLKNKNIKIDDTLKKKLEDSKSKLTEAIKNKDFKGAAKIVKDLDGLPNIIKDVNAQDILKLVDKRDIAYLAFDKLINKEITNKIFNTLHITSKEQLLPALQDKRSKIIAIIKTYKHIKNTNPALTNQILKDLSDNVNKQLDEEIKYATNKYQVLAEQQAGKRIDDLYTRATGYIDFANNYTKNYLDKAQALEDKLNQLGQNLNSLSVNNINNTSHVESQNSTNEEVNTTSWQGTIPKEEIKEVIIKDKTKIIELMKTSSENFTNYAANVFNKIINESLNSNNPEVVTMRELFSSCQLVASSKEGGLLVFSEVDNMVKMAPNSKYKKYLESLFKRFIGVDYSIYTIQDHQYTVLKDELANPVVESNLIEEEVEEKPVTKIDELFGDIIIEN